MALAAPSVMAMTTPTIPKMIRQIAIHIRTDMNRTHGLMADKMAMVLGRRHQHHHLKRNRTNWRGGIPWQGYWSVTMCDGAISGITKILRKKIVGCQNQTEPLHYG